MIAGLYAIEKEERHSGFEERYRVRQTKSKPILDNLKLWLDENIQITAPKSALGEALVYMLNAFPRLIRYIDRGDLPIDNNGAENAIRPFVVGRKAWLFSDTPAGAEECADLLSSRNGQGQ